MLKQFADGPVGNRDAETDAHSGSGAAGARDKREWHGNQCHYQGEQRHCKFPVEPNLQRDCIDSAALQIADVRRQLLEVHLLILQDFLQEVVLRFLQFAKRRCLPAEVEKLLIASRKIAAPAVLEDPGLQRGFPAGLFGRDVLANPEIGRIQLEDLRAHHQLLSRIQILVVVNVRIVMRAGSEYPVTARIQIGLDRLALDLFAYGVLLPVCAGHVIVIESE